MFDKKIRADNLILLTDSKEDWEKHWATDMIKEEMKDTLTVFWGVLGLLLISFVAD